MDGSVVRGGGDGLDVSFMLTDLKGSEFPVRYSGILPDLFREGQGVLVKGQLGRDGVFHARRCWPSTTRTTCRRSSPT